VSALCRRKAGENFEILVLLELHCGSDKEKLKVGIPAVCYILFGSKRSLTLQVKKQSELTIIMKAKDLCKYIMTITQKCPKQFRFTYVSRLIRKIKDVTVQTE